MLRPAEAVGRDFQTLVSLRVAVPAGGCPRGVVAFEDDGAAEAVTGKRQPPAYMQRSRETTNERRLEATGEDGSSGTG